MANGAAWAHGTSQNILATTTDIHSSGVRVQVEFSGPQDSGKPLTDGTLDSKSNVTGSGQEYEMAKFKV